MAINPGDEVRSGLVFRRIPPIHSRFRRGRPMIGVFRPDPHDGGELSTTWDGLAQVDKVLEVATGIPSRYGTFGLCGVAIDAVLAEGHAIRFVYKPDPLDWLLGDAHVVVADCSEDVQATLARLAVVIQPPVGPEILYLDSMLPTIERMAANPGSSPPRGLRIRREIRRLADGGLPLRATRLDIFKRTA